LKKLNIAFFEDYKEFLKIGEKPYVVDGLF